MRVVAFPFGPKGWAQQSQEVTLQWFAFRALSRTMSTDSDGTFICITSSTSLDGKNKTYRRQPLLPEVSPSTASTAERTHTQTWGESTLFQKTYNIHSYQLFGVKIRLLIWFWPISTIKMCLNLCIPCTTLPVACHLRSMSASQQSHALVGSHGTSACQQHQWKIKEHDQITGRKAASMLGFKHKLLVL